MSRLDVGDRVLLIDRQLPFERVLELLLPVAVGTEGVPGNGAPGGVELQQLLCHVAHRLLDARLRFFPRGAAEAIERRTGRAGVLLNEIEAFDGNEQLVVGRIAELHELLCVDADFDPLQADEHADAVIDVDDQVARLQVAEIREEGRRGRAPALVCPPLFIENVGLRPELERRLRKAKTLRQMADGDEHGPGRGVFATLDGRRRDLVVGQELDDPLGPALGVSDKDLGFPALARLPKLADPIRHPTGELHRRLRCDVAAASGVEIQRFQRGSLLETRRDLGPADDQRVR